MSPDQHTKELTELFSTEKLTITEVPGTNEVKTVIHRQLVSHEIGHCFSLGMRKIKRSGDGLSITFDRSKASLNEAFKSLA